MGRDYYWRLRKGIIYKLTCKPENKVYVGQTRTIHNRWAAHMSDIIDPNNKKPDTLDTYKRKYPKLSMWSFEVLEEDVPLTKLNEREKYWIDKLDSYNNGLNDSKGTTRPNKLTDTRGKKRKHLVVLPTMPTIIMSRYNLYEGDTFPSKDAMAKKLQLSKYTINKWIDQCYINLK